MALYIGHGAFVGFGVESTWDTPVTITNWLRLVSADINETSNVVARDHLGVTGQVSTNARDFFVASKESGGSLTVETSYDDSSVLLWSHALGGAADAGTGSPYTHTLTCTRTLPVGLTCEFARGDGTSQKFAGCLISEAEFSVAVGEVAKSTFTLIGGTAAAPGSAGTPTHATAAEPITADDAGDLTWNAVTYQPLSFSVKVTKGIDRRQQLGSLVTAKPDVANRMEVMVTAEIEYVSDAFISAFSAQTQGDLTLTFSGTSPHALAFTAQNAVITAVGIPVQGVGVIRQTVTWKCYSDGTDEGLKMIFTNANAATTDNA